jgi:hypothetical protein
VRLRRRFRDHGEKRRSGAGACVGVAFIVARDLLGEQRDVLAAAREQADVIERTR